MGLCSSGSSTSATDAHNTPVDGEERQRAVDGSHPTGAGVSVRREKSLLMALLVPAHATSQANPRLPRQPCRSHRSCCVKHHKRNTRLLNSVPNLNVLIQRHAYCRTFIFHPGCAPARSRWQSNVRHAAAVVTTAFTTGFSVAEISAAVHGSASPQASLPDVCVVCSHLANNGVPALWQTASSMVAGPTYWIQSSRTKAKTVKAYHSPFLSSEELDQVVETTVTRSDRRFI